MRSTVNGYIRASASQTHPFQTSLSIILTDFSPNGNKQGIPQTEKENIMRSALHAPVKINFDGVDFHGHSGAVPIGPIVSVYEGDDSGRPIICGDAVLWADMYEDISNHLKEAFAEGVGTSWEIYYDHSDVDADGIEWLHGCVFAGTCVVQVPAYGPNRTRILAIAESLHGVTMPKDTADIENEAKAEDLTDARTELNDVSDLLFKLWEGLDMLYNRTFEIEAATVETDIGKIAETFAEKIAKLADKINSLSDKLGLSTAQLEEITRERDQLRLEKEEAAQAEVKATRIAKLQEVGFDTSNEDKVARYLSMAEDVFTALVADMAELVTAKKPAVAEDKKPALIPEPLHASKQYSTKELAAEFRKEILGRE